MSVTKLFLIRHGRASAGWDTAVDPDLDDLGWQQAHEVARQLALNQKVSRVVTSPLQRCQQTSQPLCELWKISADICPEVSEIPSPEGVTMANRVEWLRVAMVGTWGALGPHYTTYRDELVAFVRNLNVDTVVFSHFIAINAVVGAILGDDRLIIHRLDNCAITIIERDHDGTLTLVQSGREADTLIR